MFQTSWARKRVWEVPWIVAFFSHSQTYSRCL